MFPERSRRANINKPLEYVFLVNKQSFSDIACRKNEDNMKIVYQKNIWALLVVALLTTGCGHQEEADLQLQSEQATEAYKKTLEAEKSITDKLAGKSDYQLPTRPDDPEPVLTLHDVQAMTSPEQLTKALVASDAAVRLAAVQGLNAFMGKLPDAALQRLINMLDAEQDTPIVMAVANLLGGSCHPAVMVFFLNNLKRDTNTINMAALNVLGDVAGYRAVEGIDLLLERLIDEQATQKAKDVRVEAESAKAKILARNGRPLLCTW